MIGEIGEKVQDDGPSGKLNSPVSIVSCGNAICIAEHPTDIKEFTTVKRVLTLLAPRVLVPHQAPGGVKIGF